MNTKQYKGCLSPQHTSFDEWGNICLEWQNEFGQGFLLTCKPVDAFEWADADRGKPGAIAFEPVKLSEEAIREAIAWLDKI